MYQALKELQDILDSEILSTIFFNFNQYKYTLTVTIIYWAYIIFKAMQLLRNQYTFRINNNENLNTLKLIKYKSPWIKELIKTANCISKKLQVIIKEGNIYKTNKVLAKLYWKEYLIGFLKMFKQQKMSK